MSLAAEEQAEYGSESGSAKLPERKRNEEIHTKNNIPDILSRYASLRGTKQSPENDRKRTEQSFLVPKAEIADNEYDLSINRYKDIVYEEVEYEKPEVIIEQIEQLDIERNNSLRSLKELLK